MTSKTSKANQNNKVNQVGGAGSDFSGLWYSWEVSPAELSRITLEKIDCSPMFNPLRKGTVIPTGTSGIIPAGVYLASLPPLVNSCATVECYNREQVGLVTEASQVAAQQAAIANNIANARLVNALTAREGVNQMTGLTSDNGLINSLANFMGMNYGGPQQTGAGLKETQKGGCCGNFREAKNNQMGNNKFYSGSQDGGCCGRDNRISHLTLAQQAHLANASSTNNQNGGKVGPNPNMKNAQQNVQKGGNMSGYTCGYSVCAPDGNPQQGGGTLSNGLGYGPFKGSQMTATSCANSCVPFTNACGVPTGRTPVYYSETESREGCTTRCRMPAARYASSNLGCRSTAFSQNRDYDLGTYDDLHGTNLAANAAPLPQPCMRRPSST